MVSDRIKSIALATASEQMIESLITTNEEIELPITQQPREEAELPYSLLYGTTPRYGNKVGKDTLHRYLGTYIATTAYTNIPTIDSDRLSYLHNYLTVSSNLPTYGTAHCWSFVISHFHFHTSTMAKMPQPPPAAGIQVSQTTFNCLVVMIFILCSCNIALVFWAVEKDLVMSVASNTHLSNGAQRLIHSLKSKEKAKERPEDALTPDQAIAMASTEQQFALNILLEAGIDVTEDIVKQLPLISDIHAQYGKKPIIHNLESCKRFRDTYDPEERFMAVAGMFNTGTNILGNLIVVSSDMQCCVSRAYNIILLIIIYVNWFNSNVIA